MTLPLDVSGIEDYAIRRAFDDLALAFPVQVQNMAPHTSARAERASGSSTLLTASMVTYFTTSITVDGARPLVVGYYFIYSNDNSGANRTITLQCRLDSSNVGQSSHVLDAPLVAGTNNRITASGIHLLTDVSAGTHTVDVQVLASAINSVTIREGELTAVAL